MGVNKLPKGKIIDVLSANERWNEYKLADGNLLRVKVIVTKVIKIEGQTDPQGNPTYFFQSQCVSQVLNPEEQKDLLLLEP